MRYYRTRKLAWDLKSGDLIEGEPAAPPECVLSVSKMLFDGELDGVTYNRAPVVRLELGEPGRFHLKAGDVSLLIWRKKAVAA